MIDKLNARATAVAVIALLSALLVYVEVQDSIAGQAIVPADAETERSSRMGEVEAEIARAGLVDDLEAALGLDFGGLWLDRANAQLDVGFTSPASRRNAEAVAVQAGLAQSVTEVPVRSTWSELLTAQERWNERLADLFERAEVKTSIVPERNALEVELGSRVPESRRESLQRAAAMAAVDVSVRVAPHPHHLLRVTTNRCAKFTKDKAYCDPSIVAGVTIDDETDSKGEGECTAGPAALKVNRKTKDIATETFILTAGHCIHVAGGVGKKWFAYNKAGERKEIGEAVAYIAKGSDVGAIKVNLDYWSKPKEIYPVESAVALWDEAKETTPEIVVDQENPAKNGKSCLSAQRIGFKCGTIESTTLSIQVEVTKDVKETLNNLVEVKLAGGAKVRDGDSGGTWVSEAAKNKVQGVQSSIKVEAPGQTESSIAAFQTLGTSFESLKNEKGLDLELLTPNNEIRHWRFKGAKYPVTIHGASATDLFTTSAGTIECTESTFHAVLSAGSSTATVTPEYKKCQTALGGATIDMEGCTYVFHVTKPVSTDTFHGYTDISCAAGKSIKVTAGTCKFEIKPQTDLEKVFFIDDTNASPKGDITVHPTVTGIAYTVTQDGFLCPFEGTGEGTDLVYTNSQSITVTGQNPSEAAEKIEIEVAE